MGDGATALLYCLPIDEFWDNCVAPRPRPSNVGTVQKLVKGSVVEIVPFEILKLVSKERGYAKLVRFLFSRST